MSDSNNSSNFWIIIVVIAAAAVIFARPSDNPANDQGNGAPVAASASSESGDSSSTFAPTDASDAAAHAKVAAQAHQRFKEKVKALREKALSQQAHAAPQSGQ